MPDLRTARRRRSSDHSLVISLIVTFFLVLVYALGLKLYTATSIADAVSGDDGVSDLSQTVAVRGDDVFVELSNGQRDRLNYVTNPKHYRAPLAVRYVIRKEGTELLVVAQQDLDHLRGAERQRALAIGAGVFVVALIGSGLYLNWPRRIEED
jgi:hypothetical protein